MKVERIVNSDTCKFLSKSSKKCLTLGLSKKKGPSSDFEKILKEEIKKLEKRK